MNERIDGSFFLALEDLDVSVFPIGSRLPSSQDFETVFRTFVERVFQSWGGCSELSWSPEDQEAHVSFSLTESLETVRDRIIRGHHVDAEPDGAATRAITYEQLELLRFVLVNDPDVHRALTELAITRRDFARALSLVQIVLSREPKDTRALVLQGRAHIGYGQISAAEESFARAYKLDNRCVDAGTELLRIMLWEGRGVSEIEKLALQIVDEAPQDSQALFTLGMIRLREGRAPEGESILRSIIRNEELPPIGEYAWKAWVELNRRFSERLRSDNLSINFWGLLESAHRHFSPLSTADAGTLRSLVFRWLKMDFHSMYMSDKNTTFHVRALAGDVRFEGLMAVLWLAVSMLAPGRKIGFKETQDLEKILRVEAREKRPSERIVFELVDLRHAGIPRENW